MNESAWDYPRPPRVEPLQRRARVEIDGETIADSTSALRVLERSHPPAIYFPRGDVRMDRLRLTRGKTVCEWKGQASYFDVVGGKRTSASAAWTYPDPNPAYRELASYIAFYPGRVDACFVDDKRVTPQQGDFYGGWITSDITGPFKGPAGTTGW